MFAEWCKFEITMCKKPTEVGEGDPALRSPHVPKVAEISRV